MLPSCIRGGMAAFGCSTGREAFELLASQQCDILLCDSDLADMDALLNEVRQRSPNIAIVISVEPKNLRDALLAMIAGASGFVTTQQDDSDFLRLF